MRRVHPFLDHANPAIATLLYSLAARSGTGPGAVLAEADRSRSLLADILVELRKLLQQLNANTYVVFLIAQGDSFKIGAVKPLDGVAVTGDNQVVIVLVVDPQSVAALRSSDIKIDDLIKDAITELQSHYRS
jgi:hypothetical protein